MTSVTLDQPGRRGRRPPWPAARTPITPSAAVGTGLGNYTITYVDGELTVDPGRADHHRRRPDQDLRPDRGLRRHRVHHDGPAQRGHRRQRDADQPRRRGDRDRGRQPVRRSPPSAAVGTGLGNYTITYVDGALTVTPAALTITADDRTKIYGQTVVFAGTEFIDQRACSTPTASTASPWPARAPRRPRPWPAARTPSPRAPRPAPGLGELRDHLCRRRADGHAGAADDRGRRPDQDLRPDGRVRRHRVHLQRPAERRHRDRASR